MFGPVKFMDVVQFMREQVRFSAKFRLYIIALNFVLAVSIACLEGKKKAPAVCRGPGEIIFKGAGCVLVIGLDFRRLFYPAEASDYVNHITHSCAEY